MSQIKRNNTRKDEGIDKSNIEEKNRPSLAEIEEAVERKDGFFNKIRRFVGGRKGGAASRPI